MSNGCVNGILVSGLPVEPITGFCTPKEIQKQEGARSIIGSGSFEPNASTNIPTGCVC